MPSLLDATEPVRLRSFSDPAATRAAIYADVLSAARALAPVSNTQHQLGLEDVDYEGPDRYSLADQKQAILSGATLGRKLRGTWVLKDVDGRTVDKKRATLAQIPHLTQRGTFVLHGSEYSLGNQARLRAGAYTRRKESGEVESHVNVLPGKGLSHRYLLEPATGLFRMQVGQASMPLYPVLRALGVSDDDLKEDWGPELLAVNSKKDDARAVDKLYTKLLGARGDAKAPPEAKRQAVAAAFRAMELDPEVTAHTLGHPHRYLTAEAMRAAVKKVLAVNRGEAEPDDRDHLAFQHFWGPEDLLAERFHRDNGLLRKLLWQASSRKNLERLPAGVFTRHVQGAILDSGLGQALEEVNASELLDHQTRLSRLGVGGIPSVDVAPMESRSVHPSQLGFVDLLRTPESLRSGLDTRVSYAALKGSDKKIYTPYFDVRTGQRQLLSPQQVFHKVIAFPGELDKGEPLVAALVHGKARLVPRARVELALPHMEHAFSPLSNLVPLKSMSKGQRISMGSRFLTQALPLEHPEAPWVQAGVPGLENTSFEELFGDHLGAVRAKNRPGKVVEVTPDGITVAYDDGAQVHETYNRLPTNRKTLFHNTPVVRVGDPVQPGQLLARSNYTDERGVAAPGLNARVAFLPFRGLNHDDAIVVSEDFAQRAKSAHAYQHVHEWDEQTRRGKKAYAGIFPGAFGREHLAKLDDEGVVRPGTTVERGDPLVLVARERELTHSRVHSAHKGSFVDASLKWDHSDPGTVTDAVKTPRGVNVVVQSYQPMRVADKLAGRHGNKGIVHVVPSHEMPHDERGRPLEVLLDPEGVISRANVSQVAEAVLGKIAAQRGSPYKVVDFAGHPNLTEWVRSEARKHNVSDTETLTDPVTGRKIPGVLTGNMHFLKLMHTAEAKSGARGLGSYTAEDAPARGGQEGAQSKKLALMSVHALLGHSAIHTLRDAKIVRGQKNQDYWAAVMNGFRPPDPGEPTVYKKFLAELQGAGIQVRRQGSQLHLSALTDRDVDALAGQRDLRNADTVRWQGGLQPVPGGLFDVNLTGGHGQTRWAALPLHEPFPNPVFEDPVRHLLKLTKQQFEDVLAGKRDLGGSTGPQAVKEALSNIDVPAAAAQARADIQSGRRTLRDQAVRRLGYLKGAEKQGVHPKEWLWRRVPVLPSLFRPVSLMQNTGGQLVSDANLLYKDLFDANKNLAELSKVSSDVGNERLAVYQAMKAVSGLGDPVSAKHREKGLTGLLGQVFSHSPKHSQVQQKLLGATADLVGRAVIVPNPDLDMDHIGLPENHAWDLFAPFLVGNMVKKGAPRLQALRYLKERAPLARQALLEELERRPVIVDRAPVLHKYGLLAFKPKLMKGDQLQVCPLVYKGYNADNDGDQMNFHVVAAEDAVEEALAKMLPSKNLISAADFKRPVHVPSQQFLAGTYHASTANNTGKRPQVFATTKDALAAFRRGELAADDPVEIVRAT